MPKISVILPVYNVEQYIAKSIHSVLNQSYIDFELIVVIDGSKIIVRLSQENLRKLI